MNERIISNLKKYELTKNLKKHFGIISMFFAAFSIILCVLFFTTSVRRQLIIYIYIIGVVIYLFIISICYFKNKITIMSNKLIWLTEENELLKKNMKSFNDRMEEIDKFRHDARNYMSLIKRESEFTSERNKLAGDILVYTDSFYYERFCENPLVNMLLNDKKIKANECDIKFENKAVVPENIPVDSKDICSLFFNLIDNAIEANETSSKVTGKWITIKSNVIGNYFIIKQSNSVFNCVETDGNGNFFTTKLNKSKHGKGLRIIEDIAEKYNGFAEFETKNNAFYSTVYLYLNDYSYKNMQNMTN